MTNFIITLFIFIIVNYRVMFSIILRFAILLFLVVCISLTINFRPLNEEGAEIAQSV
jgi:hypothetical protein